MIELPEALSLSRQLSAHLVGKTIGRVLPPTKAHKFCWFNGDVLNYEKQLQRHKVIGAEGFGLYVELSFDNGAKLCVNDGVSMRLVSGVNQRSTEIGVGDVRLPVAPKNYQLLIAFEEGMYLVFTVAMYGGIIAHGGDYDNEYYVKSRASLKPWEQGFAERFWSLCNALYPSLSAKAFVATEQRFPGIGNGVLQDILFTAGIHPKRKLASFTPEDRERLLTSIVSVTQEMTDGGGRNTEKDIFGHPGGYQTRMSKLTLSVGCPTCGGHITKETYLGGSVYYCPNCQPLKV